MKKQKIICVIPARLKSTRFPRKVLAMLKGKPLVQWVWEAANRVPVFDQVVFAIDDEETKKVVTSFGGVAYMTDAACQSGTDRLVQLAHEKKLDADIWVNWQSDEPFITPEMIQELLQTTHDNCDVWTLCKEIGHKEDVHSPHIVKVVRNAKLEALYFSRSMIPYYRDNEPNIKKVFYKHVGMYAYSDAALKKIYTFSPCMIEQAEKLEQLRFLYYGLKIKVHETSQEIFGIDLPEHLAQAEAFLKSKYLG